MPRVLIVDDDRTTVGLLKILLQLDGFEVATAGDSVSGRRQAEDFNPDAFLVDFHLADCDGTEFIEKLRGEEVFSKTPIIMASGLEREREALAAGADVFLAKPFDPFELTALLKRLLESDYPAPGSTA